MIKVSVIISMSGGRDLFFERSLNTYSKQTMAKDNFEIIIVDDDVRHDVKEICKNFSKKHSIRVQYITIDNKKSFFVPKSFTPALTNNVGFKNAMGDVVVIVGPETLVCENNLEEANKIVGKKECWYGLVFRSDANFVKTISADFGKYNSFLDLLSVPGAKADCKTRPPHPPAYWYWMVANKNDVFNICGVDERFMGGICGEDDDFSNRMKLSGVIPMFNNNMIGIHQDHSCSDALDNHSVRFTPEWQSLRKTNLDFLKDNLYNKRYIANQNHIWGDDNVIVSKEIF